MKRLKAKLTIAQAQQWMYEMLEKVSMGDKIYELAQSIFQGCINVVETNSVITDKDLLDQDQEWYDEIQEEFYQAVYDKVKKFMENGE